MSRFFKSAAFPILVVVVLAFLAVKLVNPGPQNHKPHNYQRLVAQELPEGLVKSIAIKNKGHALVVKLSDTLAGFVVARNWMEEGRAQRIAQEACEKATVILAAESESEDVSPLISHLRETGQLTDIFFLICSTDDSQHLRTLARLSRLVSSPGFLAALREATCAAEAVTVVRDFEQRLGKS